MNETSESIERERERDKEISVPDEFSRVIRDLVKDIQTTFPEMCPLVSKWWKEEKSFLYIDDETERKEYLEVSRKESILFLFKFAQKKFPPRFFDILYENKEIFNETSVLDTEFLPHIHFKNLWNFDITDKTRQMIWKYLQLLMFSIINTIENKESFGDTEKFYEAFNNDDFKTKLEETITKMQEMFDINVNENGEQTSDPNINIPNAENIHDHISGMLEGKLGKMAKEIAEETAESFNMDMDNTTDMQGVFEKMMKNPSQLMNLVKNVGDKIENRIKSGEMKESELISEAAQLVSKMKDMPGMDNIQSMLSKLGMSNIPNLGKNSKVNMNAMEDQLKRNMKQSETKERLKAKAEASRLAKEQKMAQAFNQSSGDDSAPVLTDAELEELFKFNIGTNDSSTKNKKKKKNK